MNGELGMSRFSLVSRDYMGKEQVSHGLLKRTGLGLSQAPKQHVQGAPSSIFPGGLQVKAHNSGGEEELQYELRICTNRTCRKSGSLQTLEILRGLASPNIAVESCGCLGRCGMGPNLVVLPAEIFVGHCNTVSHAARLLALQCGLSDPDNNLKALALKQQGNKAFESGDILGAEKLFSQQPYPFSQVRSAASKR
eukprot:c18132_g1_i1 orf=38-622(+)